MKQHHTRRHHLDTECDCSFCQLKKTGYYRFSNAGLRSNVEAGLATMTFQHGYSRNEAYGDLLWTERKRERRQFRQELNVERERDIDWDNQV